jgi:hypothetical protein
MLTAEPQIPEVLVVFVILECFVGLFSVEKLQALQVRGAKLYGHH